MSYKEIIPNYPPYGAAGDKRGYVSQHYKTNGHTGLDTAGNLLEMPVCAVFDGVITEAGHTATTGHQVSYQSQNGRVKAQYLHLREQALLPAGAAVKAGQVVGYEGQTGTLVSGKHLHITLWIDGARVDPLPYMKGSKLLPLEAVKKEEEFLMVRKVTRSDLNLRTGVGTGNKSYGYLPVGALLNIVETKKAADGSTWGKHTCLLAGKEVTGWSNIGDTWSVAYTGALSGGGLEKENAALKAKIANAQAALK